nr:hypothetical protein [Tanacetum cinerariifolium]
ARSLLIQGLPNDIYSLIDSNEIAKDLCDAFDRQMRGSDDEQVLLAEDQAWMESSSDSDQEINVSMVFMAQIEKVLSDLDESSSSAEETIAE